MGYKKIKILLHASKEAFDEGVLTEHQYEKLLTDLEKDLITLDRNLASQDFKNIIFKYSNA